MNAQFQKTETSAYKQFLTQQVVERFLAAPVGEVVTHDELSKIVGRNTKLPEGQTMIQRARKVMLQSHQIVMASVRGEGWKKADDQEIIKIGPATIRTTRRTSNRGIARMMCANYEGLTNEEKIKHSTSMSVLGTIALMTAPQAVSRVEKRIIANNKPDPLSEARVLQLMGE